MRATLATATALAAAALVTLSGCVTTTPKATAGNDLATRPATGVTTPTAPSHRPTPAVRTTRTAATTATPRTAARVLSLTGTGSDESPSFTTGDRWTIHYSYDCSKTYDGNGSFQVFVDYPNGSIPVNEFGPAGSDAAPATGAGAHTLTVVSDCPWRLTVTEDH